MKRERWKDLLFCLLLACGTVLVFLGTRTVWESYFGQTAAARGFSPVAPASATVARGPRHGDTVAKLTIPRLTAQLYVVEGDDPDDLRRGPGHLTGSAMPGDRGNCVIAGHRDTHFRVLKEIRPGDDIVMQTDAGRFLYRVEKTAVVAPSDTRPLRRTGSPVLNLITCYPFYYVGSAPQRFVVEARLAGKAK